MTSPLVAPEAPPSRPFIFVPPIDEKYQWPVIAKQFEEDFKEVLARPSTQEKETEKEEIFIPRSEREALKI